MQQIAVIVPCYNESRRLPAAAFISFLQSRQDIHLYFVNDGSTDNTTQVLQEIKNKTGDHCHVIALDKNKGKGEAVRTGFLTAFAENRFDFIGFLDADLSTSPEEFQRLLEKLKETGADFIIGSRVKMLNTVIERSFFRHIAGRVVASIIDSRYRMGIYDTQCGAKIFKPALIPLFCETAFSTRWLFDVEILLRLQKASIQLKGIEQPLAAWKDPGGSRISLLQVPAVLAAIFTLFRHYKKNKQA